MNSVVKYFMKRNKVLVQYVYDDYGYRYGCVVALGPGQLGWSMVHHSEDCDWKAVKPWQLPAIQWLKTQCNPADFATCMVHSPAYARWINTGGMIKVPRFNRERALEAAINKALNEKVKTSGKVVDGKVQTPTFFGELPVDEGLIDALYEMHGRSHRAKWELEHS